MTRIIMSGCTGKMGRVITAAVKEKADCKIVAGIDLKKAGCPWYCALPVIQNSR